MKRNLLILSVLAVVLIGCVTPYQDTRPPEVQRAKFVSASSLVAGGYEVVESRNDDGRGYVRVRVDVVGGAIVVNLISDKGGLLLLSGENCKGYYRDVDKWASVDCGSPSTNVSSFSVERVISEKKVMDGAMIGGFKPLVIDGGKYLLSFWAAGSGRPHHYVLRRNGIE